jgi:hypothetical protein
MFGAAACATAAKITAGTQIQIRLSTEVSSATAKTGILAGHVKEATPVVQPDDQATLALAFDEIRDGPK